jgi:hypothetical protein
MAKKDMSQEEKDARVIQRLRDENTKLRRLGRNMVREGFDLDQAITGIKEFLANDTAQIFHAKFPPVPRPQVSSRSLYDEYSPEVACLTLSDWHIAERVYKNSVIGLNDHDTLIASNKLWTIVEKFCTIVRRHEAMYPISSIWIPVLGDMSNGSIHQELILSNDLLDIPACILVSRLMIMVLERIKCLGKPIRVDCVVGNHPRTTEKMPTSVQAVTSLDWLAYIMVQQYFEGDPLVTIYAHESQQAFVQIMGHSVIVEHGYGCSGKNMSELDNSIRAIFDSKEVRSFTGNAGPAIDFVCLGDKHVPTVGPGYMINGSLSASTGLTTAWRLKPIKCVQQCWGISESNIPSFYYALTATGNRKTDNPFSKYTASFLEAYGR